MGYAEASRVLRCEGLGTVRRGKLEGHPPARPDGAPGDATHTGWNLRHAEVGNPDLVLGITGGLVGWTILFPATRAAREATGDPRRAIAARYPSKADYLPQVQAAAQALVAAGYVLDEDVPRLTEGAARRYDFYCGNGAAPASA